MHCHMHNAVQRVMLIIKHWAEPRHVQFCDARTKVFDELEHPPTIEVVYSSVDGQADVFR